MQGSYLAPVAVWLWASCFTSLNFGLPICEMGLITPTGKMFVKRNEARCIY